ncbi:MAG: hypothetical protein GX922_09340 [Firmicutes bacterium]|nr:hypothetical protein [Bacillota bacterium]
MLKWHDNEEPLRLPNLPYWVLGALLVLALLLSFLPWLTIFKFLTQYRQTLFLWGS